MVRDQFLDVTDSPTERSRHRGRLPRWAEMDLAESPSPSLSLLIFPILMIMRIRINRSCPKKQQLGGGKSTLAGLVNRVAGGRRACDMIHYSYSGNHSRNRKIKCDGGKPSCRECVITYNDANSWAHRGQYPACSCTTSAPTLRVEMAAELPGEITYLGWKSGSGCWRHC